MDLSAMFSLRHCRCAAKGLKTLTLSKDLAKHTLFNAQVDKSVIHFQKKTKPVSRVEFFSPCIFPTNERAFVQDDNTCFSVRIEESTHDLHHSQDWDFNFLAES